MGLVISIIGTLIGGLLVGILGGFIGGLMVGIGRFIFLIITVVIAISLSLFNQKYLFMPSRGKSESGRTASSKSELNLLFKSHPPF